MYNGIENVTICDHPLIKHKLTMIRDKNTGTNEFRAIIEEIAMLIGYEALRDLELDEIEIETPLEKAMCPVIAGKKPAIVPILRAGLGMVGGSAVAAINFIKQRGGKDISFLCVIAAPEGVERLHAAHPDIKIFVGNLDRQLNEKAYICPGLGDAGNRIFGTK